MKFGIFYEHQLPRPWGPKSEYQLLQDSLTQMADMLLDLSVDVPLNSIEACDVYQH